MMIRELIIADFNCPSDANGGKLFLSDDTYGIYASGGYADMSCHPAIIAL
jgi:hypothetical protein